MEYMSVIIILIKENISIFIYSHFLFFLILGIFALFGYSVFKNKFQTNSEVYQLYNFNTYSSSLMSVFSVITLESWYSMFIESASFKDCSFTLSSFYFISLIIFGNVLVYHFFLVIMLNAFESMKDLDIDKIEDDDLQRILIKNLKINKRNSVNDNLISESNVNNYSMSLIEEIEINDEKEKSFYNLNQSYNSSTIFEKKKNKMNRSILNNSLIFKPSSSGKKSILELGRYKINVANKSYLDDIPTENSFFIFSKTNLFRRLCFNICNNKVFDKVMFFFIILSTFKLAIETFYRKDDPDLDFNSQILKKISFTLSFFINIFFTTVIVVKSITLGFAFQPKSFCTDKLNIVNLFAVIGFYLNLRFKNIKDLQTLFEVI